MRVAQINSDLTQQVVIDTTKMDWQASPSIGVWRKRLDLVGSVEAGRVTSIVRYEPGSAFAAHAHPEGEEILVLEGIFSDEFGDYAKGTYLLNPEGFRHAPFSKSGCTLLVKLRQYAGIDRQQVQIMTDDLTWIAGNIPGIEFKLLYAQPNYDERMQLERWNPGTLESHQMSMKEVLVLEGVLEDEHNCYRAGTWLRYPAGIAHASYSSQGCLLYVKYL